MNTPNGFTAGLRMVGQAVLRTIQGTTNNPAQDLVATRYALDMATSALHATEDPDFCELAAETRATFGMEVLEDPWADEEPPQDEPYDDVESDDRAQRTRDMQIEAQDLNVEGGGYY